MSTPAELLKTAAKVAAMDIFNQALQREIEDDSFCEDVRLQLADIKFQVNKRFDQERRTVSARTKS